MTLRLTPSNVAPVGSAIDLPPDEEEVWRAAVKALRLKGASLSEAIEGAHLLLDAYRRQRDALVSQARKKRRGGTPG